MRDNDAILALLADLRELLLGIALILFAIFLFLLGAILSVLFTSDYFALLMIVGALVGIGGLFFACHGIHRHAVVEHDGTQD